MYKLEIPPLITPEIVEALADNPDVIKTVLDFENSEFIGEAIDDKSLYCPNLSNLKVALSNVHIHTTSAICPRIACDENTDEYSCCSFKKYREEIIQIKEQLDKFSEQLNDIHMFIMNYKSRR